MITYFDASKPESLDKSILYKIIPTAFNIPANTGSQNVFCSGALYASEIETYTSERKSMYTTIKTAVDTLSIIDMYEAEALDTLVNTGQIPHTRAQTNDITNGFI